MSRAQQSFLGHPTFRGLARRDHGGGVRKGRRKLARPVDIRRPMHVTLRAERARGEWSFLRAGHQRMIKREVFAIATKFGVRVYQFANSGNHLHLMIRANSRREFQAYLRTLSGIVARRVTGACKGNPVGKFWDELAYSRVVEWGRDFVNTKYYIIRNELESLGMPIPPRLRPAKGQGPPRS